MPFLEEKHLYGDVFYLHKKNLIFFLVLAVRRQRISQWHFFSPFSQTRNVGEKKIVSVNKQNIMEKKERKIRQKKF